MTPEKDACTSRSPIAGEQEERRPYHPLEETRSILFGLATIAEELQGAAEEALGDLHRYPTSRETALIALGRLQALGQLISREVLSLGAAVDSMEMEAALEE